MRRLAIVVLALLGAASACKSNGNGTGPSPAELTGTWDATKIEFTQVASPFTKVDVVPTGGSAVLVLVSGGGCTFTITATGGPDGVFTGTWSASSDLLSLDLAGPFFNTTWEFDMTLSNTTLTLSGADTDFTFASTPEAAKFGLVLTKQ